MESQVRTYSGLSVIAGIWLLLAPFVLNYSSSGMWQEVSFGIAVVILSLGRLVAPHVSWPSWVNALIGIWLVISPWAISATTTAARWNEVITGIVIAYLGLASAVTTTSHQHQGV